MAPHPVEADAASSPSGPPPSGSSPSGSSEPTPVELSPEEFTAAVAAVVNAFGDPTRRDIYLFVRANPGATATAVAESFGLHANVARHHLEKLTGGGYLVVDTAAPDPGAARPAGRPSKRYRATEEGAPLTFPSRRDDILTGLLARALDLLGPSAAEAMADEVGFAYGRDLAASMGPAESHKSARSALSTVADALTAHGFAAHAETNQDALTIVSECCPFGDAASQYPHVVCAVDRGMIRGLLAGIYGETAPEFEARRPDGDARCVARV